MTAVATSLSADAASPAPRRDVLRIWRLESRAEVLKSVRMPAYALPTLAFPIVFYYLFGIAFGAGPEASGAKVATYLLATYGAFGVMGASLFSFGIGLAVERGQGWMLLKRATPLPPVVHFLARLTVSVAFGALIVAALCLLGATAGGVTLAPLAWLRLAAVLLAGVVPFSAMGLSLGYVAGPNSAPAIVNLIYLPLSLASGLWLPIHMLPSLFQAIAPWLPPYHYAQLALRQVGMAQESGIWPSLAYLAAFTVVCVGAGVVGYRRDSGATFG